MSQIFISHAAEDEGVAQVIAAGLEAEGYRTWYYERDSLPAENHLIQTSRAIETSKVYLVIVSESALKSVQVETELVHAHDIGTPIMAILLGLTFDHLKKRKPMWRVAIGASVALATQRDSIQKELPKLVAGLRNLGVFAESNTKEQILVRVVGFLATEDGGFRLERLVPNDISFGPVVDKDMTVHDACRDVISILITRTSEGGSAKAIEHDLVSVWNANAEEIPRDQRVVQLTPNTPVIAILNERRYPAEILKELLMTTHDLLR